MYNSLKRHPYILFFIAIPIILLIGFVKNELIHLNIYSTYFVFETKNISILFSEFFVVLGSSYWIIEKIKLKQSILLKNIHIWITIGSVFILMFLAAFANSLNFDNTNSVVINGYIILSFLFIVIVQLLFFLNLIIGTIRTNSQKNY